MFYEVVSYKCSDSANALNCPNLPEIAHECQPVHEEVSEIESLALSISLKCMYKASFSAHFVVCLSVTKMLLKSKKQDFSHCGASNPTVKNQQTKTEQTEECQ